jgi:hypothetical protein
LRPHGLATPSSVEIAEEQFPEITWGHSHVIVDDDGLVKTFWIYGAPNEDAVRGHALALGKHPLDALHEIAGDVTRADFSGYSRRLQRCRPLWLLLSNARRKAGFGRCMCANP